MTQNGSPLPWPPAQKSFGLLLMQKSCFYTLSAQMRPTKPSGKQQQIIAMSAKQRWLSGRGMSRGGVWLYVE